MDPMNHNNDQQGKISERWVEWHSNIGGNQHLFKLDLGPLNGREIMPGARNLASLLG